MKTIFFLLPVIFFFSCSPQEIHITEAPYYETATGAKWLSDRPLFNIMLWFAGYRSVPAAEDLTGFSGLIIASPWTAFEVPETATVLVAGGYGPDYAVPLVPERRIAMEEFGKLAFSIASAHGKPALLLTNPVLPWLEEDEEVLRQFFDPPDLLEVQRTRGNSNLPRNFNPQDVSVLLLFAGPANFEALNQSQDIPVLTERIAAVDLWDDRIIASLEDHPGRMLRALTGWLRSDQTQNPVYYEPRIVKGKQYKTVVITENEPPAAETAE